MKNNAIKSYFVYILLIAFFAMISFSNLQPLSIQAHANYEPISVSIKADMTDEFGNAIPNNQKYIHFYIVASRVPTEDESITVYYRSRDISAVANNGDYERVNSSCVINSKSEPSNDGTVKIKYAVKVYGSYRAIYMENSLAINQFLLEIFKVEGNAVIKTGEQTLNCACTSSYSFNTINSSGYYHFSDYEHLFEYSIPKLEVDPDHKKSHTFKLYSGYDSIYYQKYVESCLARPYVSAHGYIDESFWSWTNAQLRIISAGKELFYYSFDGSFDDTRFALGDYNDDDDIEVHDFNVPSIIYGSLPSKYGKIKEMWLAQQDYNNFIDELTFKVSTNTDTRYFKKWEVGMLLFDDKKPEVVSAFADQTQNLTQNDKFYLQVKFSEPVQVVNSQLLKLTALINLTQTPIEFSYFAGSGTDTICFVTDLSELEFRGVISSIMINKLEYSTYIKDFALLNYSLPDYKKDYSFPYSNRLTCYIDTRNPYIDNVVVPNTIQKEFSVSVRIDSIDAGTLYYSWTKDSSPPTVYDSVINNVSSQRVTINGENYNGLYYLHLKLLSNFGRESTKSFGPYKFDNMAPVINVQYDVDSTLKEKNFTISYFDNPSECASGVYKVYMVFQGEQPIPITVVNGSFTLSASDAGFGDNEYGMKQIAFYCVDNLGNSIDLEDLDYQTYRFDTRNIFASDIEALVGQAIYNENSQIAVLAEENSNVEFKITNKSSFNQKLVFTSLLDYNNNPIDTSRYAITFSANNDYESDEEKYAVLSLITPSAGVYKICLATYPGNQIAEYYIIIGYGDDPTQNFLGINSNRTLINKVYQLSSAYSSLYYIDTNGDIATEKYGASPNLATFSSKEKAYEYALFREYEDIFAVTLNENQASWLNAGSIAGYVKANDETKIAESGQIWIRYKIKSWTYNSTKNAWRYYYYGLSSAGTTIKTASFSSNLQQAIQSVANTICENGTYNYLIDGNGVPKVDEGQIHFDQQTISITKCLSQFENNILWTGDPNIYSSFVDLSGQSYYICADANITLDTYSKLYYKTQTTDLIEIATNYNGRNIKSLITASGVYTFYDIDKNGINQFDVYIDCSPPILSFSLTSVNGDITEFILDEESNGKIFYGVSASLKRILMETDNYSYVAVYKYYRASSNVLQNVYRKEDFDERSVGLRDGEYEVKVGDRSGNCYSFLVFVNSEQMQVSVSQIANSYMLVSCNREFDQIDLYEIYLNGKMIENTYSSLARYTESGFYRIYVQDIYGSIYDEKFEFTRQYPLVTWRYLTDDGYVVYDDSITTEEISPISIKQIETAKYQIVTSTNLQFVLPIDCDFSFENVQPIYTHNTVTGVITMSALTESSDNIVLKVYYSQYPDVYVLYIISIDVESPSINVSFNTHTYNLNYVDELLRLCENEDEGTILVPSNIGFTMDKATSYAVNNNQTISSDLVYLAFTDNMGVAFAEIYIDEVLYSYIQGGATAVVSKYGHYKIIAVDKYGNKSKFSFNNEKLKDVDYFVDGEMQEPINNVHEYFDIDGNYSKVEYGNQSVEYIIHVDCYAYFYATINGEKHFYILKIEQSTISREEIIVVEMEGRKGFILQTKQDSTIELDYNIKNYEIIDGLTCYVRKNFDNSISLIYQAQQSQTDEIIIEVCMQQDKKIEPKYYKTHLSKKSPKIVILDQEDDEIDLSNERLKINGHFKISDNLDSTINYICVQFSLTGDFDNAENIYEPEKIYIDEGSYKISVRNIYGNEAEYYIILSNSFVVAVAIEHLDGTKIDLIASGDIYSNSKITFIAYSDNATFVVKRNSQDYEVYPININETMQITLSEDGIYSLTIYDDFGNSVSFNAEIKVLDIEIDENLLYGFNEKALIEYHTNTKISINSDVLSNYSYLAVKFNDNIDVIYDTITNVYDDDINLINCIGNYGDGEYQVIIKDKYGNASSRIITYQATPTLILSRTLRSLSGVQEYSIATALEIGVWANNSIIFNTNSQKYILKVDDVQTNCPLTLAYNSTNYDLSFVYKIYYIDEFGFEYQFDAHLIRKSVNILPNDMTTKYVNGVLTTQNDVSITASDNVLITYTLNGGEMLDYMPLQKLCADGIYRFTATDYAGNTAVYTVKRDTIVECQFVETKANKILLNGGVASTNRVLFSALNGDSASISKVVHDGEIVNHLDNSFEDAGFWQVLISDEVGNKKYFEFYILSHKVAHFAYTTPYEYKITEVWFKSNYGSVISYLNFVNQSNYNSEFDFFEDGEYTINMQSITTGDIDEFSFVLDSTPPNVRLVGCEEGEITKQDITIQGCKVGDTVFIYRNGTLFQKVNITSTETSMPVITEGGDYKVVVQSISGTTTELTFTRRHMLNTAGSVMIIVLTIIGTFVMLFGLAFRNREKTDI